MGALPSRKAIVEILVFSVPVTVSLFAELLTAVTDTFFAGHLGDQSGPALAAMSFATPVMGILTAVQSLFAMPIGVTVARNSGDRDLREASFFFAVTVCLTASVATSALLLLAIECLLPALGTCDESLSLLKDYLVVHSVSNVVSSVGFALSTGIRALGHPVVETIVTALSVVVDVAANCFFAFGLKLGFVGLAFGTMAGELACLCLCVVWLARAGLLPMPRGIGPEAARGHLREILEVGIAQSVPQIASSVAVGISTVAMASFGGGQVAAWGVSQRLYALAVTPLAGVSIAAQTAIASHIGRNDVDSARDATVAALALSFLVGAVSSLAVSIAGGAAVSTFGVSGTLAETARTLAVVSCSALAFAGGSQALSAWMVVHGAPRPVLAVSLARNASLALLATAFALSPCVASWRISLSIPLADCFAFVCALVFIVGFRNKRP